MPRLRRADPATPGWTRRRRGRGFSYLDQDGRPLGAADRSRCQDLVIPPAWTDVWICPWPNGHLQAVGTDEAGRRQYLYHPAWREQRDAEKFDRVLEFGASLPAARDVVSQHLQRPGMPREKALAVAFRILDLRGLRIGSESYEDSYGLATLRRDQVSTRGAKICLHFLGKSGKEHDVVLDDPELLPVVRSLRRRGSGNGELLAYKRDGRWVDVTSSDINEYLREVGVDGTAKDFRTWQAGLRALVTLSTAPSHTDRRTVVARAIEDAANHLGNTATIARSSYVDPRVVQLYLQGESLPLVDDDCLVAWEPALLELLG